MILFLNLGFEGNSMFFDRLTLREKAQNFKGVFTRATTKHNLMRLLVLTIGRHPSGFL